MTSAESGPEEREPRSRGVASDRGWFLAVSGTAFAFLALAGYPRQWSLGLLINDEFWYAHLARSLYDGLGYVSNVMYPMQAPLYEAFPVPEAMKQSGFSLVSAAVWLLTGASVRAMLVIAALGLALFAGLTFLLARRLGWRRPVALAAAAASIVNPVVAQYGVQALPESLYFAGFILVVWLMLRGRTLDVVLAGAANAALIIVKGHGIIYIPVFAAWLWLRGSGGLRDGLRPDGRKARAVAGYVAALFGTLILANLVLPSGSVALFHSGGTYSHGFLIETGRATDALPYLEIEPVDPVRYILDHPGQYLDKVARQVRRTKVILDDLGAPALNGILFPLLLAALALLLVDALAPGKLLPERSFPGDDGATAEERARRQREPYLLFAAIIAMTFAFFWPIFTVTRFVTHPLPLMLLLVLYVLWRLGGLVGEAPQRLRRAAAGAALLYFLVYPAAVTVWVSYRHPLQYIGSQLAVRFVDYGRVAANIETRFGDEPGGPVIVSEMAHEITWLTGARTILFPASPADLQYLIDRYDVDAIYEHPLFPHDWPMIAQQFSLADDADGRLWVRRRGR